MRPIDRVLERLENVTRHGGRYLASCPTRRDSDPSLWISEGEKGQVLFKDFGGATVEEIVAALGMEMVDLYPDQPRGRRMVAAKTKREKEYTTPTLPEERTFREGLTRWFEKRGIGVETIRHFGVYSGEHFFRKAEGMTPAICIPYWHGEKVVNIKYRSATVKDFAMESGAMPVFFNAQHITAETRTIIIAEGEMDVMAIWQAMGVEAISPPSGSESISEEVIAAAARFLEDESIRVILAGDMDPAGVKMQDDIARRIGKERCSRVHWPSDCKDANDTLMKHGEETVRHCIDTAEPFPIDGVIRVGDVMDRVWSLYADGLPPGESTGIRSLDTVYTIKTGYFSMVTGSPGSGKSNMLDQTMVNLAENANWRFAISSLENKHVDRHIANIMPKWSRKAFGSKYAHNRMNAGDVNDAGAWMEDHFEFIQPEEPSLDEILRRARSLVFSHGIKGLVIDPWNQIDHPPAGLSNGDYISECLSAIGRFAYRHDVHVWLVAHPTKLVKDAKGLYPVPTLYDIAGSAHFFNKADFGWAMWRNVLDWNEPVQFHEQKSRHAEIAVPGKILLGYDPATTRYYDLEADGSDNTSFNWRPVDFMQRIFDQEEQEFMVDEHELAEARVMEEAMEA
jgi:twinkle protein